MINDFACLEKYILISKSYKILKDIESKSSIQLEDGNTYSFGVLDPDVLWSGKNLINITYNLINVISKFSSVIRISNIESYMVTKIVKDPISDTSRRVIFPVFTIDYTDNNENTMSIPLFLSSEYLYSMNPFEEPLRSIHIICPISTLINENLFEDGSFTLSKFNFDLSSSEIAIDLKNNYSQIQDYMHLDNNEFNKLKVIADRLFINPDAIATYDQDKTGLLDFMPLEGVKTSDKEKENGLIVNRLRSVQTPDGVKVKGTFYFKTKNDDDPSDTVLLYPTENQLTIVKLPESVYMKDNNTLIDFNMGETDLTRLQVIIDEGKIPFTNATNLIARESPYSTVFSSRCGARSNTYSLKPAGENALDFFNSFTTQSMANKFNPILLENYFMLIEEAVTYIRSTEFANLVDNESSKFGDKSLAIKELLTLQDGIVADVLSNQKILYSNRSIDEYPITIPRVTIPFLQVNNSMNEDIFLEAKEVSIRIYEILKERLEKRFIGLQMMYGFESIENDSNLALIELENVWLFHSSSGIEEKENLEIRNSTSTTPVIKHIGVAEESAYKTKSNRDIIFIKSGKEFTIIPDGTYDIASEGAVMDKMDVTFRKLIKKLKAIPGIPAQIYAKLNEIYRHFLSILNNTSKNQEMDAIEKYTNEEVFPWLETTLRFIKAAVLGTIVGGLVGNFLIGLIATLVFKSFFDKRFKTIRKRIRITIEGEIEILNKEIDYAEQKGELDKVPKLIRARRLYERLMEKIDEERFEELMNKKR